MLITALFLASAVVEAKTIDLSKSSFTWRGSKVIGDHHAGPIKMKTATFKNGKGEFVADLTTIGETTLSGEWKTKFLSHIKSGDFFDVKKYPTATLKINKLDSGYMYGDLTIKGKTHPVTAAYTKKGNTYSGELGFDRTKFDMKYNSTNYFKKLGDKAINDTVTLKFKVVTK